MQGLPTLGLQDNRLDQPKESFDDCLTRGMALRPNPHLGRVGSEGKRAQSPPIDPPHVLRGKSSRPHLAVVIEPPDDFLTACRRRFAMRKY
jgi:hypothetical protein